MPACRCNFQCTLDVLMPLYICKIRFLTVADVRKFRFDVYYQWLWSWLTREESNYITQMFYGINCEAFYECSFTRIRFGNDQSFKAFPLRLHCNRQGAANRTHFSIQTELTHDHKLFERFWLIDLFG